MKHQLILSGLLLMVSSTVSAQSYFDDDIYYNPNKDKNKNQTTTKSAKKQSNYIANMADMDVDLYNRRDQYYVTPIDTIGAGVENGEDFVYTQQIQKYYNPTIVVDNADVLGDVLANAYGNVEIVINDAGLPVFSPYYSYGWPYYNRWGFNIGGWGWNLSFYDPWYAWNWGPSWSWGPGWGPAWSWGWGPSWAWGPSWSWGWRPGWVGQPPMANWRPNGARPVGPAPGWSGNHRPGVGSPSYAHNAPSYGNGTRPGGVSGQQGVNNHRPAPGYNSNASGNVRPVSSAQSRPGNGNVGVVNNNGRWEYVNGGHRVPQGSVNSNGARPGNNGNSNMSRPANNNQNTNNGAHRVITNSNRNNSNSNRNYNTNSSNSNRSFNTGRSGSSNRGGGSFGGSRSSGGTRSGGGGRHR